MLCYLPIVWRALVSLPWLNTLVGAGFICYLAYQPVIFRLVLLSKHPNTVDGYLVCFLRLLGEIVFRGSTMLEVPSVHAPLQYDIL